MRILLDECVPRRLVSALSGYDIHTVADKGWTGKKNGELLKLMAAEQFDILMTIDQNLQYQQNLSQFSISVIVLSAGRNRVVDLMPLIPQVKVAIAAIHPGEIVVVHA